MQVLAASYDQIQIFDEALERPCPAASQSARRRSSVSISGLAEILEAEDDF
jgi:hypothetical protein